MADTCYLCEMGAQSVLHSRLAAGQGFGTCHECSVHACPRHGERTSQFFYCADCIAAAGLSESLTSTAASGAAARRGMAPRLSSFSHQLRRQFDPLRMSATLDWVRTRAHEGQPLLLRVEEGAPPSQVHAATSLSLISEELDWEAVTEDLEFRLALVESEVGAMLREGGEGPMGDAPEEQRERAGAAAVASLAVAYEARGTEDPELGPRDFLGGLTLPPVAIVVGDAYAHARHLLW